MQSEGNFFFLLGQDDYFPPLCTKNHFRWREAAGKWVFATHRLLLASTYGNPLIANALKWSRNLFARPLYQRRTNTSSFPNCLPTLQPLQPPGLPTNCYYSYSPQIYKGSATTHSASRSTKNLLRLTQLPGKGKIYNHSSYHQVYHFSWSPFPGPFGAWKPS